MDHLREFFYQYFPIIFQFEALHPIHTLEHLKYIRKTSKGVLIVCLIAPSALFDRLRCNTATHYHCRWCADKSGSHELLVM